MFIDCQAMKEIQWQHRLACVQVHNPSGSVFSSDDGEGVWLAGATLCTLHGATENELIILYI